MLVKNDTGLGERKFLEVTPKVWRVTLVGGIHEHSLVIALSNLIAPVDDVGCPKVVVVSQLNGRQDVKCPHVGRCGHLNEWRRTSTQSVLDPWIVK